MSLKPCCATGSLHTGTPTGRIDKVHGLDCYVADAPNGSPKGIVVIIPGKSGSYPRHHMHDRGSLTIFSQMLSDGHYPTIVRWFKGIWQLA